MKKDDNDLERVIRQWKGPREGGHGFSVIRQEYEDVKQTQSDHAERNEMPDRLPESNEFFID